MNKTIRLLLISLFLVIGIVFSACNYRNRESKKTNDIAGSLEIDIKQVPFSYRGSAIAISNNQRNEGLGIFDVTGNGYFGDGEIFRVQIVDSIADANKVVYCVPNHLSIRLNSNTLFDATYQSSKILRMRGKDIPLRLKLGENAKISKYSNSNIFVTVQLKAGASNYILKLNHGSLDCSNDSSFITLIPAIDQSYEVVIQESDKDWALESTTLPFDDCLKEASKDFDLYRSKMPLVKSGYAETMDLASYVLWESTLNSGGLLKRPGILMSKNWMHYIWSWDHCFNALATMYGMPDVSWDQFMIMFDQIDDSGQLPDLIGRGLKITDFVKPPIHGWTLRKLQNHIELDPEQLQHAYVNLSRWTEYWFKYRDSNKNGMPEYHHGNDSGWDNGTEFDFDGKPNGTSLYESSNLYAYLIIQMDVLAEIAVKLGQPDDATYWQNKSDTMLSRLLSEYWDGNKFLTKHILGGTDTGNGKSLMAYLPIVLGEKLPAEIRAKLVDGLLNEGFITEFGLATESISSDLYEDDGYWRGPIWAPTTLIIVDGLEKSGYHELAKEIAIKFCNMCSKSGFAENFDAKTGEGLRDLGYTWTASVFVVLANEYIGK